MRSAFRPLRSRFVFPTLARAIAAANQRHGETFRVVHYSVQVDHVHLIVEAKDTGALSRGMRALAIHLAKSVNALVSRRGRVWADRWHGLPLTSPRQTRNALRYVLANFRKHQANAKDEIDPYSSAPYFAGFREYAGRPPLPSNRDFLPGALDPPHLSIVLPPSTWLLHTGWRRSGLLSVFDAPTAEGA